MVWCWIAMLSAGICHKANFVLMACYCLVPCRVCCDDAQFILSLRCPLQLACFCALTSANLMSFRDEKRRVFCSFPEYILSSPVQPSPPPPPHPIPPPKPTPPTLLLHSPCPLLVKLLYEPLDENDAEHSRQSPRIDLSP